MADGGGGGRILQRSHSTSGLSSLVLGSSSPRESGLCSPQDGGVRPDRFFQDHSLHSFSTGNLKCSYDDDSGVQAGNSGCKNSDTPLLRPHSARRGLPGSTPSPCDLPEIAQKGAHDKGFDDITSPPLLSSRRVSISNHVETPKSVESIGSLRRSSIADITSRTTRLLPVSPTSSAPLEALKNDPNTNATKSDTPPKNFENVKTNWRRTSMLASSQTFQDKTTKTFSLPSPTASFSLSSANCTHEAGELQVYLPEDQETSSRVRSQAIEQDSVGEPLFAGECSDASSSQAETQLDESERQARRTISSSYRLPSRSILMKELSSYSEQSAAEEFTKSKIACDKSMECDSKVHNQQFETTREKDQFLPAAPSMPHEEAAKTAKVSLYRPISPSKQPKGERAWSNFTEASTNVCNEDSSTSMRSLKAPQTSPRRGEMLSSGSPRRQLVASSPRRGDLSSSPRRRGESPLTPLSDVPDALKLGPARRISRPAVMKLSSPIDGFVDDVTADVEAAHQNQNDRNIDFAKKLLNGEFESQAREVDKLKAEIQSLTESEKDCKNKLEISNELLIASRQAHQDEVKALKERMRGLDERMKEIISKREEVVAMEDNGIAEMNMQLAAACKLIEKMKNQLLTLTEERKELEQTVSSLTAHVVTLESQSSMSKTVAHDKVADATNANKKIRLAQEQMAKLIAIHAKEIATWTSTCDDLRKEVSNIKLAEKEIRKELDYSRKRNAELQEEQFRYANLHFKKQEGISREVQTESNSKMKGKWHPWVWLVSLLMLAGQHPVTESIEIQTDLSLASKLKPSTKNSSTLTNQDTVVYKSDFERWWSGILEVCEEELKAFKVKAKMQMSKPQLFGLINSVYSEKIVQDEVDDREGRPRLNLPNFLHLYFLEQTSSATSADRAIIMVLTNVLAQIRGICVSSIGDEGIDEKLSTSGVDKTPNALTSTAKNGRIQLFARFLGLRSDGEDPIPLPGLNVYLAALARAQNGSSPLLPASGERIMVSSAHFEKTLDWIFGQTRSISREAIKGNFMQRNRDFDNTDLDLALDYTLQKWTECMTISDARLEALFSTVSAFANFDFETFEEMMKKLKVDEPCLPGHNCRLRMFQELCIYPRVDSGIFAKVAKSYGICMFNIGGFTKLDEEGNASFDTLTPLYSTALRTISSKLSELDQLGVGRGIEKKWSICGELVKERELPERAWIFYHVVTKQYTTLMRLLKKRGEKGYSNAQVIDFAALDIDFLKKKESGKRQ